MREVWTIEVQDSDSSSALHCEGYMTLVAHAGSGIVIRGLV